MVISYEEIAGAAEGDRARAGGIHRGLRGVDLGWHRGRRRLIESLTSLQSSRRDTAPALDQQYRVLAQVLDRLDGRHAGRERRRLGRRRRSWSTPHRASTTRTTTARPTTRAGYRIAEERAALGRLLRAYRRARSSTPLGPRTVSGRGCATGMLVEALRDRGVDARGIDMSNWAIDQVPADLRPFCKVGSITDELEGHYDLITCSEVLEHLPPSLAAESVANLCRHADAILFSSTPDDFDEPTHLNVESGWLLGAAVLSPGFCARRRLTTRRSSLHHAVLFRRRRRRHRRADRGLRARPARTSPRMLWDLVSKRRSPSTTVWRNGTTP